MKRFVVAAALVGLAAVASTAQAGSPRPENLYLAGHHHHHHHHRAYYPPPVVRYYPPPVRYCVPAPVYAPPVVYGSYYRPYYRPWNNVSVGGPNFGVQIGW
jgi:hypothetical protein